MESIYDREINGFFDVLVKEEKPLSYTDFFKKLNENKDRKLAHRDFSKILATMVEENLLAKTDAGRRGTKVYYSLTAQAKQKHQLKILGEGEIYEKRREIYHLLLYYDVFKRDNLLTKIQLNKLLKRADIDFDGISNIEREDEERIKNYNALLGDFRIENAKLLGCLKGIVIGEHLENKGAKRKNRSRYYVVIPGFTEEEFISYLNKLKKNNEPKPFTNNIPLIPYIRYKTYTKEELTESIELLRKAGLLRLVSPIFNGEMRYAISDSRLLGLFFLLKLIHLYQFELTIGKILHIEKPDEEDKNYLIYFFGEQLSNILIANAHELRKTFQNDNQNNNKLKEIKKGIKELEEKRDVLINQLKETYGHILQSNILLQDLIE